MKPVQYRCHPTERTLFNSLHYQWNGNADADYVTVYNQDITSYATANTAIRFLTNDDV